MNETNIVEEYKAPKDHAELKRMVEQFRTLTQANNLRAAKDRDYYDGYQLSDSVKAELDKRGQPAIHTNKIAPAINGMLGLLDTNETAPEAFPRTFKDRDAADVATKVLRYLAEKSRLKQVKQRCSETFFIEGIAAAIVDWDGKDVTLNRVRWDEFIYDPLSREHDFADASFLGVGKLMDRDDVKALFPDTYTGSGAPTEEFMSFSDDKSKAKFWGSNDRRLVRVIDLYYRVGHEWHRAMFTVGEILFQGASLFTDDCGCSMCPVLAASFEVDRSGDRYGPVRNMIPQQDEVNSRRSRLLHLTNHRQVQQTQLNAPAANRSIAVKEAARADGVIPYGYEVIQTQDLAQGQMLIYQQSVSDLERMAPSPAVLGRGGGANESGRARMMLQQAGMTELARQFARFEDFELRIYRTLWASAKSFLNEPMWIRITDDPRTMEFMQVNEPVYGTVARPVPHPETGQPLVDPTTGQPATVLGQGVVGIKNRLSELDMDIILSTVPDPLTLEQEVFEKLVDYASSMRMSPFSPEFAAMLEISSLPNKRETLERIKAAAAEAQQTNQGPDPVQQQALILGMEEKKANIDLAQARASKDHAQAQATTAETFGKTMERATHAAMVNHIIGQNPAPPAF